MNDEDFLVVGDGEASVVVFSSLGGPHHLDEETPFDFANSISEVPCKKVFIRDHSGRWFCHGIRGADTVHELGWYISHAIGKRSLFIGHSAGGFAALLYGNLCGATKIVAFSPQTNLEDSGQWWDTMRGNGLSNVVDLRKVVSRGGVPSTVVCCTGNKNDVKAAKYVGGLSNVTLNIDDGCATHNSARDWRNSGKLLELIKEFIVQK